MAAKYFIISALFIVQTISHQCQWMNMRLKYNELWQALDGMGEKFASKCLITDDRRLHVNLRMPKRVFRESLPDEDAMKTTLETFQQISKIFQKSLGSASRDDGRSESLCILLHRVTADLEECMRPMKRKGLRNHLRVKKYFRRMEKYLKDRGYEQCAWEIAKSKIKMLLPDVRRLMMAL